MGYKDLAPEMLQLDCLTTFNHPLLKHQQLTRVQSKDNQFPIEWLTLGTERDDSPVLFIVGGVHGVERIGSQVVLAFLETLLTRLGWDDSLSAGLENLRIHFIPILNPIGLLKGTRCNGNGVDLMRNAPVDAEGVSHFLVGGQRFSKNLPWYRGDKEKMEPELVELCKLVTAEFKQAPITMVLDVHSGYGFHDSLWFPLACSQKPIANLPEFFGLKELIKGTYPHLDYVFEPQAKRYCTHGDLWDYLYLEAQKCDNVLLPLTLEMGSWNWVRKNPLQLRRMLGLFNPIKPHRVRRVLRRHIVLMECLIRATRSYHNWCKQGDERETLRRRALTEWYVKNGA